MFKRFHPVLAVVFAGLVCVSGPARAQQPAGPQRIGFVDMTEVFKKYKKFTTLRDELKADFEASEQRARALFDKMKQLQGEMKGFDPASVDYAEREKQLNTLKAEMETFSQRVQRELMARQSETNKTIYLEVLDMVNGLARANNYSVVLRVNNPPEKMEEDPAGTMQWMNQPVIVYSRDDDLTGDVIHYLNERYKPAGNITPAAGTTTTGPARGPAARPAVGRP
ncbi:MAG: OmpH family outer membrane protein [Planctomycetales bacterium]